MTHTERGRLKLCRNEMRAKEQRPMSTGHCVLAGSSLSGTLFGLRSAVRPPKDPRISGIVLGMPDNHNLEAGPCASCRKKVFDLGSTMTQVGVRAYASKTLFSHS